MLDYLQHKSFLSHDMKLAERLEKRREETKNKVFESNGELQ